MPCLYIIHSKFWYTNSCICNIMKGYFNENLHLTPWNIQMTTSKCYYRRTDKVAPWMHTQGMDIETDFKELKRVPRVTRAKTRTCLVQTDCRRWGHNLLPWILPTGLSSDFEVSPAECIWNLKTTWYLHIPKQLQKPLKGSKVKEPNQMTSRVSSVHPTFCSWFAEREAVS